MKLHFDGDLPRRFVERRHYTLRPAICRAMIWPVFFVTPRQWQSSLTASKLPHFLILTSPPNRNRHAFWKAGRKEFSMKSQTFDSRQRQARQVLMLFCALSLAFSILWPASAQQGAARQQKTAKRALTHQDYDSWRSIQGQTLSRNGKFI